MKLAQTDGVMHNSYTLHTSHGQPMHSSFILTRLQPAQASFIALQMELVIDSPFDHREVQSETTVVIFNIWTPMPNGPGHPCRSRSPALPATKKPAAPRNAGGGGQAG